MQYDASCIADGTPVPSDRSTLAAKVAGVIFARLNAAGECRITERALCEHLGAGRRTVQAALRKLEASGQIGVARARTGTVVRWLSTVGGPRTVDHPLKGVGPRGPRGPRSTGSDPDREARIGEFRAGLSPEGLATLEAIYGERRGLQLEREHATGKVSAGRRARTLASIDAERAGMRHERLLLAREMPLAERKQRLRELAEVLKTAPAEAERIARERLVVVTHEPEPDWLSEPERAECDKLLADMRERFSGPTTRELARRAAAPRKETA